MDKKVIKMLFICFSILLAVFVNESMSKDSEEAKFSAMVYPVQGSPFAVENFTINGKHYYDALHKGKEVKLKFEDIKTIIFLNPGKHYDVEVVFNNGSKDTYILQPAANLEIRSQSAIVTMSHIKLAKIEFGPLPEPKPRVNELIKTFDVVELKNGDYLSGKIQTQILQLHGAYGTITFKTADIRQIYFDGRGENKDVVFLRMGDVMTGALQLESISLLSRDGKEVNISPEQISRVFFKR